MMVMCIDRVGELSNGKIYHVVGAYTDKDGSFFNLKEVSGSYFQRRFVVLTVGSYIEKLKRSYVQSRG